MNQEQDFETNKDISFEQIQKEIKEKLEVAQNNPLKTGRYIELEKVLKSQREKFFEKGNKNSQDIALDTQIKNEVLKSAAIVKTVSEYREMLDQISKKYNLGDAWRDDLLDHENAHANVSGQIGYEDIGYGMFFLSNENGVIESIQPTHIHEEPHAWTPVEVIENGIRTLEAPKMYGNKMSEADLFERDDLLIEREKLEQKKVDNESKRQVDLSEIRRSLGI